MTVLVNMMLGRGRGGLERAAANYYHALAARGYEVVTVGHSDGWLRTQVPRNSQFRPLSAFTEYDFRAQFLLSLFMREVEPAAVIAHGNRAMRYAGRLNGVMRIGVLHNLRFKSATRHLNACIAVTHSLAAAARQRFPALAVEMVPNLVDVISDGTRPGRRAPIVIGALGRLHVDKGFDYLIEALADRRIIERDWRLIVAGEGPELTRLRALATKKGLSGKVHFVGWVEDRSAFFRSIDILCMPSRVEAFGLVLIEALAHAVPVIASDNSGSREIVVTERDALVVPSSDPEGLAQALERLIDDPRFAESLGRRGWERVIAGYTLPVVAERLEKVVSKLIGGLAMGTPTAPEVDRHPKPAVPA